MRELNWQIFKVKFNGKERSAFETLSYHLFCSEFNNRVGLFRFKNQTGIETEPIQTIEGLYGFQAKFYDTKISENKDDIIDSIRKAKRENAGISKIYFYLNQEFSESKVKGQKDPTYKIEIESEANMVGIDIEWRVPSHFERQLALPEIQYLTDYFFVQGDSVFELIEGLKKHTSNLLSGIQTDIVFNKQAIKIDRQTIINSVRLTSNQKNLLIISGEGGAGKTAIIKELYGLHKDSIPFYVFKAIEFNIAEIKTLFNSYGNYSLQNFIEQHKKEKHKVVVVDSAERISDLDNQEPFKEFLSALTDNDWTVIFTTRLSYLDDLRFQFLTIYRLPFEHLNIGILSNIELENISKQYSFELPDNVRMKNIIRNPFYLDEYLRNYEDNTKAIVYEQFKENIWSRKIQNSAYRKYNTHLLREQCFLNIVKIRSEKGTLIVRPTNCNETILSLLLSDEIIGFDKNYDGYFITHDLYEEWGLNTLIERAYNGNTNYKLFLNEIGTSLIVRRAFRQWLSDKLIDNIHLIKHFIEEAFDSNEIEKFWKDEILTSILLSEYANEFYSIFKEQILENECSILKKITFLLSIACKESDDKISMLLSKTDDLSLNYVFTKPKGYGWHATIHFIFQNQDQIPLHLLSNIILILSDWSNSNKKGNTTREAGQLALKFYKEIQTSGNYRFSNDYNAQLTKIIIHSSNEIKPQLEDLIDSFLLNKNSKNREQYEDFCENVIGSDIDNISIWVALPEHILKLINLFWIDSEKEKYRNSFGTEKYYGLNQHVKHEYFPASAFQTPIYWLLLVSFEKTIDFIIEFTNNAIENYVKSGFDNNMEEIELYFGNEKYHKQYVSEALWNMYRGVGSPVSPYLLQSIHMALEKHLLEAAKNEDPEIIESWLISMMTKSKSASITSIVTSIVLAYPTKFFNAARVLFSSMPLFIYDNLRAIIGEREAKRIYSIGRGLNYRSKRFENERTNTCEEIHRRDSLESLILKYQFVREEHITIEEFNKRRTEIWAIIDKFYHQFPAKEDETDTDKTHKLLLARIDLRKMQPKIEKQDDKIIVAFNPEIDNDLKAHSEEATMDSNELLKYSNLKLWAQFKFDDTEKYIDQHNYDNDVSRVISETKEIIESLASVDNDSFILFNSSTPAYTCAALLTFHSSELNKADLEFCKENILLYAKSLFEPNYNYQIADGVEVAIKSLPFLIKLFPNEKDEFLKILLLTLYDQTPIGEYKRVCDYAIESILNNFPLIGFENHEKILWTFLKFKSAFNKVRKDIKESTKENYSWQPYSQFDIIIEFTKRHSGELNDFILHSTPEVIDLKEYSLPDLEIAFQLIPNNTQNEDIISLISKIFPLFAQNLLKENREDRIDFYLRFRVFKKLSYFILHRDPDEINKFLEPFIKHFSVNEHSTKLFEEFIFAQDIVRQYDQFWTVWESFYEKVVECSASTNYRLSEVIHSYLLAGKDWMTISLNWHSLREKEKTFYKKAIRDMGQLPSVLDSVAKLLNEIASEFINEGILWISEMIEKNKDYELEKNTIYYIEKLVRTYVYKQRNKIRHDIRAKNKIIIILNFLIDKGSVNAYLLREDLL